MPTRRSKPDRPQQPGSQQPGPLQLGPQQLGLFGPLESESPATLAVEPCAIGDELRALARALPGQLRLGTSSWAFPGWRGLVYGERTASKLPARAALAAYAQHALLTAVGVDHTFYAPIAEAAFADYAAAVPAHFRCLVKAWSEVTSPTVHGKPGANARYLDVDTAIDQVLAPAFGGLGDKLGPLLFQFPPQGASITRRPAAFADRLHTFFAALPKGVHYAVELRDEALFTERYVQALAASSARHCFCVHPRMPSITRQRELVPCDGPIVVRWMLHAGLDYERAKERYAPFDKLVDADPERRAEIGTLSTEALARGLPMTVIVNNKAEGSAPLSVIELARWIAAAARDDAN